MMKPSAIKRRDFIGKTAAFGAGLALAGIPRWGMGSQDRPNILLIYVDQDRYPTHTPPINRPILDLLKKTGVEFTNSYCSYPLCSPSRSTLITGRYPHEVGVLTNIDPYQNNPSLSPYIPGIGTVFSEAGYETSYFGKWHLTRKPRKSPDMKRFGFNTFELSNQGIAYHSDKVLCEKTAKWIGKHKNGARPWMCICSPINPHDICVPPISHLYGDIPDYPVKMPPNFVEDPGAIYPQFADYLKMRAPKLMHQDSEEGWIHYLRFYLYLTELVDRRIGMLLDAIDSSGQSQNTVIVYTTDHGEMGGAHGMVNKSYAMYEEISHIPLVISGLARRDLNRQHTGLVSGIDLVPTMAGIAGIKWPERLPGADLSPLLGDRSIPEREEIFCEGMGERAVVHPWRGIRRGKYKYWHYMDGTEFLFDLEKDPNEVDNLAAGAQHEDLKADLCARVRKFRTDTLDPFREFIA